MRRITAIGTVSGVIAGVLILATPGAWAYSEYDLAANTKIKIGTKTTLVSHTQFWAAGETRTIQGVLAATSTTTGNMLVAARVTCGSSYGISTTQNNAGKPEVTTVTVNWIWTAPSANTWTCSLVGSTGAGSGASSTDSITAQANKQTNLKISTSTWLGSTTWSTSTDCSLDPPACDDPSDPNGVFVGPGTGGGSAEYVLHSGTWTAVSTTTKVLVQMDAELTACYYGTVSCPSTDWGPANLSHSGSSGSYYPVITITNASGGSCSTYNGTSQPFSISWDQHHKKIFSQTILTIAAGSSCRRFSAKIYLAVSSSLNPLKVEASTYSIGYFLNYQ